MRRIPVLLLLFAAFSSVGATIGQGVGAAPSPTPGPPSTAADYTVKNLGNGIYAAISTDDGNSQCNTGFVIGSDSVLVVDTFVNPESGRNLLAEVRKVTKLPIRYVVNTHYHFDHNGGNGVFAEAGATILAQRNVRTWLHTENIKLFGPTRPPEAQALIDALVPPNIVYDDAVDIYLGTRLVQVRYMLGHTGSDSVVIIPDANVVFTGDLVWQKHMPQLINASTQPWIQTLDRLLADHATATFVSGHGDLATADDVRDFRGYLSTLRADIAKAQSEGKAGDDLVTVVAAELKGKYGGWYGFDKISKRNITQTAAELSGTKRLPVPAAQ
jgi:glyoxylase-like metal-dependent hydrolase (beta-lactamase superfamily II)